MLTTSARLAARGRVGPMGAPHRASVLCDAAGGHQPVDKVSIFLRLPLSVAVTLPRRGLLLLSRYNTVALDLLIKLLCVLPKYYVLDTVGIP